MSDVDIVLDIAVKNVDKVYNLSNALQQLNRAIDGSLNPMRNLDARSRALSSAIGSSDSSLKNHAKSVAELTRNNAVLTNELGRVRKEISGLGTSYRFASRASSDFKTIAVRDLKAYEESLKGIRVRALVEDLKSLSQEQKRLGKDAQFVGRSLIIGLTTPIMTFSRMGLQSLVAIDKEFVRLNKVLESVAPNIESAAKKMGVDLNSASKEQNKQLQTMVDKYNQLDKALTNTSTKFGMAKSLTVGLAGDFAELGIQTTENIALITELTAKTEKLGNMDVGAAKDLVQSLYFQAVRAMQQSGESVGMPFQERERKAIQAATAQLNLFNSVENVTALTLRDLGDAFPEVAAAATSFGLSMTEAAALLAPMKAAGFETGASANSIKVSLQRLTAPTKQNAEMFKQLSKEYNVNFNAIKGTGLDAIQQLVDGFNTLKDSAAGQEGAMEFFAKVFGVRQGPRMEVAIAQMAEFDKLLKNDLIPATDSAEKRLQGYANSAIRSANRTTNANLPVINSFRDIGIVARIATATAGQQVEGLAKKVTQEQINAAKSVRTELSKEILKAQREGGEDLIGQVGTEAGRAMFIELAGTANAAGVAQRELEASLASLDTQLSILKNNFKMFTAELVKSLKPAIEKISEISTKLYNAWSGLDAQTKKLISTVALIAGGATAAIGPLIFVFGQFRLAMGSIGKVLFGFLPGLKTMTIEALAASEGMTRLTKPISMMGDTVVNTNGKFATFIATLASGDGPVGRMADRLGRMTGVLQQTSTAPLPVMRALKAQKGDGSLMPNVDPSLRGGASAPVDIRKLVRTRTGIIDPTDPTARIPRALRKAFAEEEFSMEQQGLRRGGAAGTRYNIRERFGIRGTRTGFRSISAADVGEAINLRQLGFERTGITRTSTSSSLGGGKIMRMGREISEERALGIARGGARGRLLQAYDTATAKSSASMTSALASIKGAPTAAVDSYKKGLQAAKDAQKALRIESLAFTGEGPGAFARMRAGVMGFAKSFSLVNNAIKLTKVTLIASGIGIIILSIGVAVMLIMKNMDKFKEAGSKGLKVVGEAFNIIKNAAMELVRPIVDLFASFGSGAEGTEGAVSGLGNIFNALANVLKFVAQVFSWLVTTIIQPYLYIVVNIVKFIINLFSGNFTEALKSLGAVFAGVFGMVAKLGLEIVGFLVKQIINIFFEIPSAFIKAWAFGIEKVTDMFFGFAEFILNQIKRAGPLGKFFGGVGDSVLGGMKNARDAYVGTVRTVAKAVDGAGDFIKRGIDKGVNAAQKSVDKLAKGGVKKSKGKFDLFGGKDENSVDVDTDDAQEKIASASGDGMKEGAEEGSKELAKRAKQALKDLKREVQEEIADRIKNAMESVVDQIQDALKAQKEASLKVYDDQIKKIEDVAKSEGRLTKEMEYQNRLREAEAERSLNRMNSKRNYALAVYAGNIDEARVIADESARQEIADNQKIDDINKDRAKEIAEQNKADLIDSIKDAKQKASEYFDSMIKTFTDAAKKITEFPPTTAEEFNTMLNQLIEGGNGFIGAKTIANNMGTLFSQSFSGALSQLGVNASGPLTSSLEAIGKTLTENNPFGENGIWNKTIDASIDALTRKYKGLTNTLTTIIDTKSDAFKDLYETYKKYQDLVNPAEGTGGGTTGGAGGTTGGNGGYGKGFNSDGVKVGNKVAIAAANADLKKIKDYSDKYLENKYGKTAEGKRLVASIKGTVGSIASSAVLLGGHDAGMKDYMPVVLASKYRDQITTNSELVYAYIMNNRALFLKGSGAQGRTDEKGRSGFFKGGMLPYMMGGATKGPTQQGIPALLHGGEYVVRNSAVKKYGWGMMQQINQGTYKPKPYANGGMIQDSSKDKKNLNYGNVLNDPNSLFMQSIEKWRKDNPDKVERDEKAKAMLWKQIAMGGRNLDFFDNIMLNETGYKVNKSTRPKLGDRSDIGWYNVGLGGRGGLSFNPMWNKSKINGKLVPDPTKGLSKSGGLQINAWAAYGGLQYAPFADQATPYEQMVIYNRKTLFGWQGGMQNGVMYPAKPGIEGGWLTHLYNKNISEKLLPTFFGNMQLYEDWNNYNGKLTANKNIKNIGKQVGGFERILLDNGTFQYYKKISSGKYEPVDKKDVKKGKYSYIHPFDVRNPEYSDGYAIGGLVKGKSKKSSAADFRKAETEGIYKFNSMIMKESMKNRLQAMKDSGYNVANQRAALNPFSDLLYKPENAKVSLWDKTLGKAVTAVGNTAKLATSSFISGVSFAPEYAVALLSTLAGYIPGTGKRQNNGSLFNQLVASPLMQTSLAQRLKAAKLTITTGQDYRTLYGLDRGPFGLAGFLPMTAGEKAMEEASRSRNILGKGTMLSPGGALAYFGLEKTGLSKEGSKLYMGTQLGGDFAAMAALDPTMSFTKGLKAFGKGVKTAPKVFTKAGRGDIANSYWEFLRKHPFLDKLDTEARTLRKGLLNQEIYSHSNGVFSLEDNVYLPARQVWFNRKELARNRLNLTNHMTADDIVDDLFGGTETVRNYYGENQNSIFQEMFANRFARKEMGMGNKIIYPTLPRIISRKFTGNIPMDEYFSTLLTTHESLRPMVRSAIELQLMKGNVDRFPTVKELLKRTGKEDVMPLLRSGKEKALDIFSKPISMRKNVDNLVPYSNIRTPGLDEYYKFAFDTYKFNKRAKEIAMKHRVLENIRQSKLGRTGGYRGASDIYEFLKIADTELPDYAQKYFKNMSFQDKIKAVRSPRIPSVSFQHDIAGNNHTITLFRQGVPPGFSTSVDDANTLFTSSKFTFGIYDYGTNDTRLGIGGLYSLKDFTSTDIPNLLGYVYANVIKPNNVTKITNSSYSKYSYALSRQLSAIMSELDPAIEVVTPNIYDWSPNNIGFNPDLGRLRFSSPEDALLNFTEADALKDPITSIKTKAAARQIIKARIASKKKGLEVYTPDELEKAKFAIEELRNLMFQYIESIRKQFNPDLYPYGPFGMGMAFNPSEVLQRPYGLTGFMPDIQSQYLADLGNSHYIYPEYIPQTGNALDDDIKGLLDFYNRLRNPVLPEPPASSPWPRRIGGNFNGGLIQSFEKGGLVKGKDKTSAGQFRMFDSISDFDIQRITYNAEQQVKKGKKNIFQKIGGAITSPFKGIKNRLQKEMFGAMYGKGTGTTGSYADTYKGFAEATKDANIFNPRGLGNYEAPAGSIFANEALRQGMSMIRTGMDFTPSGGIMSAGNAADKNRSGLSRLGWALASYGAIAGNPTIFAPNSGYMGGAGKGIKGISNLQKTIQEASNVEQFFPGTRIPMPAGLRPTLSQETGAILNQIGANASLHRHTNNMGSDAWHVRQTTNNLMNIQDRYINIRDDITRSDAVREMARNAVLRMRGLDAAGIRSGSSAFRSPSFPVNDFIRTARSSGFADDQIFEALSKARIANDFDWYGYSDFDRFMDALYTGKVINRTLPRMSKYPPYFPPEILARRIQQAEIKENVLKNINISKSIRLAKIRGVVSGKEAQRALRDNMILEVEQSASGRAYTLHTWQRLKDGSFGNTSKFTFDIDDDFKALDVGYLQRGNSFASAMDLMKMLSYVYSDIMLPNGIKTINPGSTSVHSEAMVIKLKEVFKKFDPDIKFGSGYGGEWQPTSLNTIDFDNEPYLFHYKNFMRNVLEANNVFLDPAVRLRTHTILKNLIDNSKGITGEAKSSIIDRIGGYANGGFVNAFASQGVPAILHGGEYVINSSAVKNLGISALQALNDMRFNTPKSPSYSGPVQPQSSSTSTVHIYVDNFIGEKQWFESMMKDYNINVAPQNQKAAGLNNTTISTYRGINRGL